ncbi:uncharacterized protein LOC62_07G008885 [Vanrija pseudolonga]|uniref:BRCT domain-containing protein n=1 Tax=Vanrija pseudolonga TaxID=143232 RepID=A0AAF0YIR8_9TREE|nr:hypothetical protein LOC62_07G008885 [Vanrija pseudolonga]
MLKGRMSDTQWASRTFEKRRFYVPPEGSGIDTRLWSQSVIQLHGGEIVASLTPGPFVIVERPKSASLSYPYIHYLPDNYMPPADGTRNFNSLMYEIYSLNKTERRCIVYTSDWLAYCLDRCDPIHNSRASLIYEVSVVILSVKEYNELYKFSPSAPPAGNAQKDRAPALRSTKIFARGRKSPLTFYLDQNCAKLQRMIEASTTNTSSSDAQDEGGEVVEPWSAIILVADATNWADVMDDTQREVLDQRSLASFVVTPSYVVECVVKDTVLDPTPFVLPSGEQ